MLLDVNNNKNTKNISVCEGNQRRTNGQGAGSGGGGQNFAKLTCPAYHLTPRTCTVLQPVGRVEEGHSFPHLSLEYAQDPQDNQGYAPTQIQ